MTDRRPPAPSAAEREAIDALAEAWDREPDAVWEPWVPAICQWVRVSLSECAWDFPYYEDGTGRRLGRMGHPDALNGAVGQVVGFTEPPYSLDGHRFRVQFEQPIDVAGGLCLSAYFAAAELTPAARPHDDEGAEGQ